VVLGIGFRRWRRRWRACFLGADGFGEWRGLYFFELGLALLSLACVLPQAAARRPHQGLREMDFVTFGLFAPGVALLSAVLALGRTVWWLESRWLGYALIGAIVLITAALAVEHNRARPLLNTRWLTNANIARLALSVLLIRVVQSEASGTVGFLQALGLNNDQMLELWWIVMFGAIAGMVSAR
jgi:NhaP-type Na+/H+ and K+/H+ antiporter